MLIKISFHYGMECKTYSSKQGRAIKYWNLKTSAYNLWPIPDKILAQTLMESHIKDYTSTLEEVQETRAGAKSHLQKLLKEADKIREDELRERAKMARIEGDDRATFSYESLIKQGKRRAIGEK